MKKCLISKTNSLQNLRTFLYQNFIWNVFAINLTVGRLVHLFKCIIISCVFIGQTVKWYCGTEVPSLLCIELILKIFYFNGWAPCLVGGWRKSWHGLFPKPWLRLRVWVRAPFDVVNTLQSAPKIDNRTQSQGLEKVSTKKEFLGL